MFLLLVKILLLIPVVNGVQSCYSGCNQYIPFNTTLPPPTTCQPQSNSSLVCAVSVTYYSNHENNISIFYFTPSVSASRPSIVETQVNLLNRVLSVHIFHECPDCDILENTRNIIASMQSIPEWTTDAVSQMSNLFPIDNSTSKTIECYNGDDEKETFNQCESCLLATHTTSAIRSCSNSIGPIGVRLLEKTTLDNKREFDAVYIECVQSRCNTRNIAQAALRILADTGLAQHFYDLSSSAIIVSYSFTYMLVHTIILIVRAIN
jgi:hypothetical protein